MIATGADLTVVVPLWKRTANIERVVTTFGATVPDSEVVLVGSVDDDAVLAVLSGSLPENVRVLVANWPGGIAGDYGRKINAGYLASSRPFIFTGADDVVPHPGWYEAARALMGQTIVCETCGATQHNLIPDERVRVHGDQRGTLYHEGHGDTGLGQWRPHTLIGVVGTVDLCNGRTVNGQHSTHSLVARWYADNGAVVDQPGAIYHEGYTHEFVDDELVRNAVSRGAYVHAFDSIVEHVHMLRDRDLDDDVYRHGRANNRKNRALFLRRRQLWGDGQRIQYPRPVVRRR